MGILIKSEELQTLHSTARISTESSYLLLQLSWRKAPCVWSLLVTRPSKLTSVMEILFHYNMHRLRTFDSGLQYLLTHLGSLNA